MRSVVLVVLVLVGALPAACGEADDDPTCAPVPDPTAIETPAASNVLVTTLSDTGVQAVGQKVLKTGRFEYGDTYLYSSYGHIVGTQLLTPCRRWFILVGKDTTRRNISSSSTG